MDAEIKFKSKAAGRDVTTYMQGECMVVVVEPGFRSGYRLLVSAPERQPTDEEIAAAMECIPRGVVMQVHKSQVTDWIAHLEQIEGAGEGEQEGEPTLTVDEMWKRKISSRAQGGPVR